MGIGIVLIGHLILIFIMSLVIAVISAIVTFIISKKKRKAVLAFILPFIFLLTLYFNALIGSIIVSEVKNVDIGIGDAWYAPINDSCKIAMIDTPTIGYIQCNEEVLVDNITELEQYPDSIIQGKTTNENERFFVLNLKNLEVKYYLSEQELRENTGEKEHPLIEVADFEATKYKQAAGKALLIVGIISLIISSLISFLLSKIFLLTITKILLFFKKQ